MWQPRIRLAGAMTALAALALNFGAVRAFRDGMEEHLLYVALPMVNVMAIVGFAGLRRRRLRPFALGFVAAGALSLLAFLAWSDAHPWTFLHIFEPPIKALDRVVEQVFPAAHVVVLVSILLVAFAIPHAVLGLAAGCLTSKIWSIAGRRFRNVDSLGRAPG